MAGSRTLKLSILGDVDNLTKNLKTAAKDTDDFGDKIGKAGKAIGAAFAAAAAAAGAYALKIGVDGVKAAIEDEKAQTQLALALKNATGATEGAIAATEQFILQTSLATGVADDDLRPALARLARSTGSVDEAQKLLNTALDISIATGKPLEGVANALSKSYDGNNAALGKLGLGLSAAELKTMNFTEVQAKLSDLFGGAAAANADTYAGRIARMQVAFNEAKETIGFALLPVLEKAMKFVNDFATPVLTAFSDALSGDTKTGLGSRIADFVDTVKTLFTPIIEGMRDAFNSVKAAIIENKDKFGEFWEVIKYIAPLVGSVIGKTFTAVGEVAGKVIGIISNILAALKPLINFAIDGINAVIKGWNLIKTGPDVALIPKIGAAQPGFAGTMPNGMPLGTISTADVPDTSIDTGGGGLSTGGGGLSTGGGSTVGGGNGLATAVATGVKAGIASAQISGTFNAGQFAQGEAASLAAYEAQLIQDAADAEWQAALAVIEKQKVEDIIAMVTARVASAPVTVNMGVVGDPEAAARAIVDVLNRSSGRGALGAEGLVL
jgi:hypothetical protein